MKDIEIVLLSVPPSIYNEAMLPMLERLGGSGRVRDRYRTVIHVVMTVPETLETVAQLYDRLHTAIRARTDARRVSQRTINRIRYVNDPACIVPTCDIPQKGTCEKICGGDIWSTPFHYEGENNPRGDCDDIEMLVAGMGGGKPLFVRPNSKAQGHVMHLVEPYATDAKDYCIPAGMPPWNGLRQCFFFDGPNRIEGTVNRNHSMRLEHYKCQW